MRWGLDQTALDEYSLTEVLPPRAKRRVLFEHFDADGRTVDSTSARNIEKWIEVDDVTITFIDTSGLRWRRTGSGEPVRVVHPPPGKSEHGPGLATGALVEELIGSVA